MSLVSLAGWQYSNLNNLYAGQNAAMNSAAGMQNMLLNPLQYSPAQAHNIEKQLTFQSLNGQMMAKIAEVQHDPIKKMRDKNIERSFNVFA